MNVFLPHLYSYHPVLPLIPLWDCCSYLASGTNSRLHLHPSYWFTNHRKKKVIRDWNFPNMQQKEWTNWTWKYSLKPFK